MRASINRQRPARAAVPRAFRYPSGVERFRYKAFISYSHRDRQWASWLQRALERYRVPRRLVGTAGALGPVPRRLAPVFRDRSDLSTAADLSGQVKQALKDSSALIVICSPAAAQSSWVNEEIRHFQALGRGQRVFALIVDGDPQSDDPALQCFPGALCVDAAGNPCEPLAADLRKWADGKLLSRLKIISGVLGVRLDDLRRRDQQRRQRLWLASTFVSLGIAAAMAVLAMLAVNARNAADNRRAHAEELVGYIVGDLKTRLDEVGRLDILEAMGQRVVDYLQTLDPDELTDESLVQQAKVWRQLGEVSMTQGDLGAALESFSTSRDITAELQRRNPREPAFVFELGNAEFWVGYVHLETGDFTRAEHALNDYLAWSYRLSELEPDKAAWAMEQSYAHSNLAALIIRRGSSEVDEALLHIEQAVHFNRQAIELAPEGSDFEAELSETMAWLADTQMLACDLGGALGSRQEGVALALRQVERSPGNFNLRRRYAYALSGLSSVMRQVGMVEQAIENFRLSEAILAELLAIDPSNLTVRQDRLVRAAYIAELEADSDKLDAALAQLQSLEPGFDELLQTESVSTMRSRSDWLEFQLGWSLVLGRVGNAPEAERRLDLAVAELAGLLDASASAAALSGVLARARFEFWQQRGLDLLDDPRFENVPESVLAGGTSCSDRANQVRQAILVGDMETARQGTAELLGRGYFEPGFVRMCRQYQLCQGSG